MTEYDPSRPNIFRSLHDVEPSRLATTGDSHYEKGTKSEENMPHAEGRESKKTKRIGNAGAKIFSMMLDTMENDD
ncbi:hypothetical protein XU18_2828 [Perkinsela sp. CCAP 1560/4]|nr:hypothetical protein XU18_2828 [Perkinsela sp. CCAP 1560/4]|eukprot:KNH06323.1 hypothetical protein XU18_2828 [Perkinsela sp. CCAP 1560/4]